MPRGSAAIDSETLSLTDRTMKERMAREYFAATKAGVSGGALADAIIALSGSARAHGIERPVYTRVAAIGSSVYLDLGRRDHRIVTISADGWDVTTAPADVRFVRHRGMCHYRCQYAAAHPSLSCSHT